MLEQIAEQRGACHDGEELVESAEQRARRLIKEALRIAGWDALERLSLPRFFSNETQRGDASNSPSPLNGEKVAEGRMRGDLVPGFIQAQ